MACRAGSVGCEYTNELFGSQASVSASLPVRSPVVHAALARSSSEHLSLRCPNLYSQQQPASTAETAAAVAKANNPLAQGEARLSATRSCTDTRAGSDRCADCEED